MNVSEIVVGWEQQRWPASLMRCEHNYLTLKIGIDSHLARANSLSLDDIDAVIVNLGDTRTGGKLIYIPIAANPAANLPHDDIRELKDIRNLADIKRVSDLPKEKLQKYMHLRPASPAFHEFNERVQYIREHRISGDPSIAEPVKPPTPATPSAAKLAAIRAEVDALRGYTASVTSFRNNLHTEIREMIADRQSLERIEQHVRARIKTYESGSIR